MVYCGQPSRGCQMCRTRRIKCDETKPTCNRCAKSRRQCPGYKDDFDLVFRNETQATERRAQKVSRKTSTQKKQQHVYSDTSDRSSPVSSTGASSPGGSWAAVTPSLAISVQERATCHFIANFILVPKDGRTIGHLDFVLPLLNSEGMDSHLHHAFNACSMAFLNNRAGVGVELRDQTLNEYSLALSRTNQALRDKDAQLSDGTLAAVLLLGMFESISAKQIMKSNWGSHVNGAVQLVKARGKKQVNTQIGLQLFTAVRSLMTIYCLTTSTAPVMGADWWLEDTEFGKIELGARSLMIKTSEIRAQMRQLIDRAVKTPQTVELMLDIIRKAQALDREVSAWQANMPAEWRHTTVAWVDKVPNGNYEHADAFPGRVDVYSDIWIASSANSARVGRLILQSMIVRCAAWICAPVDYRITPEYATAASVCRDAIADIIASVPYFLGWHLRRNGAYQRPTSPGEFGSFACGEEDGIKGLAGYLVTWPLTVVISLDYSTDAQRTWVMGRLRKIGGDFGVRYALAMSQLEFRAPSMLIHRDGLLTASSSPIHSPSFEKVEQYSQGDDMMQKVKMEDIDAGMDDSAIDDTHCIKREWSTA